MDEGPRNLVAGVLRIYEAHMHVLVRRDVQEARRRQREVEVRSGLRQLVEPDLQGMSALALRVVHDLSGVCDRAPGGIADADDADPDAAVVHDAVLHDTHPVRPTIIHDLAETATLEDRARAVKVKVLVVCLRYGVAEPKLYLHVVQGLRRRGVDSDVPLSEAVARPTASAIGVGCIGVLDRLHHLAVESIPADLCRHSGPMLSGGAEKLHGISQRHRAPGAQAHVRGLYCVFSAQLTLDGLQDRLDLLPHRRIAGEAQGVELVHDRPVVPCGPSARSAEGVDAPKLVVQEVDAAHDHRLGRRGARGLEGRERSHRVSVVHLHFHLLEPREVAGVTSRQHENKIGDPAGHEVQADLHGLCAPTPSLVQLLAVVAHSAFCVVQHWLAIREHPHCRAVLDPVVPAVVNYLQERVRREGDARDVEGVEQPLGVSPRKLQGHPP
mmetsp:Transcript_110394/g.311372  ORF Transcript_110394/g.311372 Transcript_110394/m.311372 type:complete len:440 (-) Transcript_110394:2538-3857(-)